MKILHISYAHNKCASLDGLERNYSEVLPEGDSALEERSVWKRSMTKSPSVALLQSMMS